MSGRKCASFISATVEFLNSHQDRADVASSSLFTDNLNTKHASWNKSATFNLAMTLHIIFVP
jgi:hypothetical protein